MLADDVRMQSFREAIEKLLPIGGTVLELGGGTGALSFFAAQRAKKVWCVERNRELVEFARQTLAKNPNTECIEVIEADAAEYLPPEPVDMVICEMLHTALVREKQVEIINSFKDRYLRKFGPPLPIMVPDTSLLAVQAVNHDFAVNGYYAPVPVFQIPYHQQPLTTALSELKIYETVQYRELLPLYICWNGILVATEDGEVNALRFVTKNLIGIFQDEERWNEWHNNYLVLPIERPLRVEAGDWIDVSLRYRVGAPISDLADSMVVSVSR